MPHERTKEQKEDLAKVHAFEKLISYPEWKVYEKLLNDLKKPHHQALIQPLTSLGDLFAGEYAKGALSALTAATDLPAVTIKTVREQLSLSPDPEED